MRKQELSGDLFNSNATYFYHWSRGIQYKRLNLKAVPFIYLSDTLLQANFTFMRLNYNVIAVILDTAGCKIWTVPS